MRAPLQKRSRCWLGLFWAGLALSVAVGVLGRGYWTPDEPREADIAWRMSWQADKAVPQLAGDAFCEKPPLTYWLAAAAIKVAGTAAWAARLPNLLYALITALAVGALGRRAVGPLAGLAAAAAISTLLLSYQVTIWLATDAPLLAAVAVASLGLFVGFYAGSSGERLRGYCCMHAALALAFLSKSAAAFMVPVLTFLTLVIWERRWRELCRWELYVGSLIQAVVILAWVASVYAGPEGAAHLKVFFWNNLAGRFVHIDAPEELQYAAAHRNSPGKYLIELPVYLWPWTLLVAAAARRAWSQRHDPAHERRAVRFALAAFLPTLGVLSVAATARNIYLAPALPGVALLLGWWVSALSNDGRSIRAAHPADDHLVNEPLPANAPSSVGGLRAVNDSQPTNEPPESRRPPGSHGGERWDRRALRATALLLLSGSGVLGGATVIVARDAWSEIPSHAIFVSVVLAGLLLCAGLSMAAWRAAGQGFTLRALFAMLLAYCALLVGPASQLYRRVDTWQDLGAIGHAIAVDATGRPLILFAPDETTRAFIDLYARTSVEFIAGPVTPAALLRLRADLARDPRGVVVTQLRERRDSRTLRDLAERMGIRPSAVSADDPAPAWSVPLRLHVAHRYGLPNGRRYALLELDAPRPM